ncbi:MAG: DUF3100 domain-containing protein [Neisseriaceae bacterium]|nr:DUF3100 domain-containing protein [Neisseriaceae bacterium]
MRSSVTLSQLFNWRLHVLVTLLAVAAESIGIIKFSIGIGMVILLPLLYAFVLSIFFNPNIVPKMGRIVGEPATKVASYWVLICVMPFIAKFAVGIGPKINDVLAAGPALIMQEIGNVATVLVALPVAVLVFGMGREAIGATHSIAREPNIALIADRFGLKSREGMGVMGVYVMGTLFGAIYFSLLAGLIASWNIFDIRALAMACGVGSGSMMGACSAALAEVVPERSEDIIAFAASSNLLTYATGLFVSIFVALPAAEWLYKVTDKLRKTPRFNQKQKADFEQNIDQFGEIDEAMANEEAPLSMKQMAVALVLMCFILLISNWAGTGTGMLAALPGMLILFGCCLVGLMVRRVVPFNIPAIAWVSMAAVVIALPVMPMADYVIEATDKLGLLPLISPALAYAGIAISQIEVKLFKRSGVKIAIVALLTFTGTYMGSVLIADWML